MRLLHTADWHLGRTLHRVPLLEAQAVVLDHLVDLARAEAVDAIVLAGDVFDRALPPVEAVQLAGDALRRLAEVAPVVAISGNHDSAQRLGFAAELIAAGGVHLRTDPRGSGEPVLLQDEHGLVAIYGVPYLDPDLSRGPLGVEERSHEAVLGAATARAAADLRARRADGGDGASVRGVVVAHAFVQGGEPSESERDISIGGAQTVPPSLFDGFAYTALGHLHRPHAVGVAGAGDEGGTTDEDRTAGGAGARPAAAAPATDDVPAADDVPTAADAAVPDGAAEAGEPIALSLFDDPGIGSAPLPVPDPAASAVVEERAGDGPGDAAGAAAPSAAVRYAGSPLPYSFTEADAAKSTAIVDVGADGGVDVRLVPAPVPFTLVRLRGDLPDLLDDPALAAHEADDHWLEITLTDVRLPARPMERLRRRFPRVLVLQHAPDGELAPATVAAARVQGRTDLQVLERFVTDVRGAEADADETDLLREAVEHVTRDPGSR